MTIRTRRAITGYLFILPFILGFLVFMVRPLINSLYMSFCEVNPNGLTNAEHYSTARDMARLARHVMQDEKFREIVLQQKQLQQLKQRQM